MWTIDAKKSLSTAYANPIQHYHEYFAVYYILHRWKKIKYCKWFFSTIEKKSHNFDNNPIFKTTEKRLFMQLTYFHNICYETELINYSMEKITKFKLKQTTNPNRKTHTIRVPSTVNVNSLRRTKPMPNRRRDRMWNRGPTDWAPLIWEPSETFCITDWRQNSCGTLTKNQRAEGGKALGVGEEVTGSTSKLRPCLTS